MLISARMRKRKIHLHVCYPRKAIIFTLSKDFLMKISLNWIKEILDFDLSAEETSEILTDIGLEVEKSEQYENIKGG